MDAGFKDADGYVFVMSRSDDVINVAGHRLSTGAIEEVRCSKVVGYVKLLKMTSLQTYSMEKKVFIILSPIANTMK